MRGAALLWALIAVMLVSLLALGAAQLVTARYLNSERARGYTRAYYIGESAANWQLARMSLVDPFTPPGPGRLSADQVQNYATDATGYFTLSGVDGVTPLNGNVKISLKDLHGGTWAAPGDFLLGVVGQDPATQVARGLYFQGHGTGLADRYSLYGVGGINLNGDASRADGVCTLDKRYIGTDGALNLSGNPPATTAGFGGCRLGPDAPTPGSPWTTGWDVPRLASPARWPAIDEVVRYVWNGARVADLQSQNNNSQISYRQPDGTYALFPTAPTRLTDAEFALSTYTTPAGTQQRTIKLSVMDPTLTAAHNLFYFTDVQMGQNDVLVLDLSNPNSTVPTAIRILIDNPNLPEPTVKVTNLAYISGSSPPGWLDSSGHAYLWLNNTNSPFEYSPTLPADPQSAGQANIATDLRGLVYGINLSSALQAGDIIVNGNGALNVTVDCLVGNHITINGKVTLNNPLLFEQGTDQNRYVLFYRIVNVLTDTDENFNQNPIHVPIAGYGQFQ